MSDESSDRAGASPALVVGLLMAAYTLNLLDRTIIGVLAEPIKRDLAISDAQIGLMSGFAFAICYSTMSLPIARLSETRSRVSILSLCITLWSLMTALCGVAQNFIQLFAARVGVGLGEAGFTPAAQSLVADSVPPESRATALGVLSLGIPLGTLSGALIGGFVADAFGWRAAFLIVGIPGILLAILIRSFLKEPARTLDEAEGEDIPSLAVVVRQFSSNKRLMLITMSNTLIAFVGFAIIVFAVPLLMRQYGHSTSKAAVGFAVVYGLSSFVGMSLSGFLADRFARTRGLDRLRLPAIGLFLCAPIYMFAVFGNPLLLVAGIVAATILRDLHSGPVMGEIVSAVPQRMRARTVAIVFLLMNLIGVGLGPLCVGWASDILSVHFLGDDAGLCLPGIKAATPQIADLCREASFNALRIALAGACALYLVAGAGLLLASAKGARPIAYGSERG